MVTMSDARHYMVRFGKLIIPEKFQRLNDIPNKNPAKTTIMFQSPVITLLCLLWAEGARDLIRINERIN